METYENSVFKKLVIDTNTNLIIKSDLAEGELLTNEKINKWGLKKINNE